MGGLRVLIVDDYDPDRRFATIMLERSGAFASVQEVTSADAALAYCRELALGTALPIDVILLDINMPRTNGFEFLEAYTDIFGEDLASAPAVVMLTSSDEPEDQARARGCCRAVIDYVLKPLKVPDAQRLAVKLAQKSCVPRG